MSNLITNPQWHDVINQVDFSEPIVGGDGGNANLATRQLAESTLWLKANAEENIKVLTDHESAPNPHPQYSLKTAMEEQLKILHDRIDELSATAGVGVVLGRVDTSFSGSTGSYSLVNSTISGVHVSKVISGDYNLIPLGSFANSSISNFVCQPEHPSRVMHMNYPDGFSDDTHVVRSNHGNIIKKADGTGIEFTVPYQTERRPDADGTTNERKYSVDVVYYFEIVSK